MTLARSILVPALALLALAGVARAQQAPPGPRAQEDALAHLLFPPELVMQHQEAIGLNDEQKTDLKAEIRQAQLKFTDWQWKLQDEMEKLVSLVRQPRVEEQEALVQLEKVLAIEREIKRAQVTLLVRIKNKLTAEQQAKLVKIRSKSGAMQ